MIDGSLTIKKLHKRRFFLIPTLILIILVFGILWQHYMNRYEEEKYNPPGQLIKVNSHKMHIYAAGEGSPTVVFTVGSGTPCAYTDYYYIQKKYQRR